MFYQLKINEDSLLCLIYLALDFPNMPGLHYTIYLNLSYGPCHDLPNPVKVGTVNNALRSLRFSQKRAAFCPPAGNSVWFRIYRVAWSLLMKEISFKKDVLFGFIDEVAITVTDGKKYGCAFVRITPLINSNVT
ncbi:hypothetical protein M9Y10_001861 [Tritrichomonas musculus]|uniref:Uncharacterized protein n=1 Tax=Tritrichomonas musculus TaxID=1915356 RepID=A0ABR2L865_9EUKA